MFKKLLSFLASLSPEDAIPGPLTLARLQKLKSRPLPPELAVAPPRPDVWGERGYLAQPRYQSRYKHLLLHGFATWGFVYHYSGSASGGEYDFTASYAWLDAEGDLQVRHLKDGYDALHAAYGRGLGDIVLDMDAELNEDVELVILHELRTGEHIPYRALRASPGLEGPKPSQAPHSPPPLPGDDRREPAGTFRLEWDTSRKSRSARLVRPTRKRPEVLFTVQRAGSSNREWTLTRSGERAASLRAIHQPAPGFAASFRMVDARGQPVGAVTEKAGRVRLVAFSDPRKRNFYTGSGDSKKKRVLIEEMQDVLTLERTGSKDRDTVVLQVPMHRPLLELLILGLVAVRHPPRQQKE